jgi:hypothetical protein
MALLVLICNVRVQLAKVKQKGGGHGSCDSHVTNVCARFKKVELEPSCQLLCCIPIFSCIVAYLQGC